MHDESHSSDTHKWFSWEKKKPESSEQIKEGLQTYAQIWDRFII